jgi:hypothetical protein
MSDITPDAVRAALYEVWGRQACQFPHQWPDTFARLMAPNDAKRTCLKPRYEAAIVTLAEAYSAGALPETSALALIHAAFSHLDTVHRAKLHRQLVALAATALGEEAAHAA